MATIENSPQPSSSDTYREFDEIFLDRLAQNFNADPEETKTRLLVAWKEIPSTEREMYAIVAKRLHPGDLDAQSRFVLDVMAASAVRQALENVHESVDKIRSAHQTPTEPVRVFLPIEPDLEAV